MDADQKIRVALMFVSAALSLTALFLAVHGIVSPLDGIGVGPH